MTQTKKSKKQKLCPKFLTLSIDISITMHDTLKMVKTLLQSTKKATKSVLQKFSNLIGQPSYCRETNFSRWRRKLIGKLGRKTQVKLFQVSPTTYQKIRCANSFSFLNVRNDWTTKRRPMTGSCSSSGCSEDISRGEELVERISFCKIIKVCVTRKKTCEH